MAIFLKVNNRLQVMSKFLKPSLELTITPSRGKRALNPPPKRRIPPWLYKDTRVMYNENLTLENSQFIKEYVQSKYSPPEVEAQTTVAKNSPLKENAIEPSTVEWTPQSRRTGVIAKKIGVCPMWMKDGKKVMTTLLQVFDNHVVKYTPANKYVPGFNKQLRIRRKLGCMLVGADSVDPQKLTKAYCGLFANSGLMPKRILRRFFVSRDAALQPGTPLFATHFKPGEIVDIRGKTMDRGFQGVCKRWGFKGQPASHGQTKTHRRPGNIGSGGKKGRVMPGTKLPGHMGNRWRTFKGVRILRINTKYNVMWVLGTHLPGETNSYLQIYDTILPRKRYLQPPHFPTYLPNREAEPLPEELIADDVHPFTAPTIEFSDKQP